MRKLKFIAIILLTLALTPMSCFAQDLDSQSLLNSAKQIVDNINPNDVANKVDQVINSEEGKKVLNVVNDFLQSSETQNAIKDTVKDAAAEVQKVTTTSAAKVSTTQSSTNIVEKDLSQSLLNTPGNSITYKTQFTYPGTISTLMYVTENMGSVTNSDFLSGYKIRLANSYFGGAVDSIATCYNSNIKSTHQIYKYVYQGISYTFTIICKNGVAHIYIYSALDGNLEFEELCNQQIITKQ